MSGVRVSDTRRSLVLESCWLWPICLLLLSLLSFPSMISLFLRRLLKREREQKNEARPARFEIFF